MKLLLAALVGFTLAPTSASAYDGLQPTRVVVNERYECRDVPGGSAGWIQVNGTRREIVVPPSRECGWVPTTRRTTFR